MLDEYKIAICIEEEFKNFVFYLKLNKEWRPPSLVTTIGYLLDMRSREIQLRKLRG